MKRFCFLVALMLLSSSAYAGNSISFIGRRTSHPYRCVQALPFDFLRLGVGLGVSRPRSL